MNLFDTLNEALNEEVVSKIAKLSEEEPEKTKKALDGIFYTLIAGLVRRTGSMMSVSMLYNQVQKGNQGGELVGNIMSYLNKKDKLDAIIKTGDGLVSQIFPAYKSPLVSMIGTYAGIKKNSSTMYSSLAAPILIDAVSKEIDNNKLDVEGLINFLSEHHEPLFQKAPDDLLEKMIPQLGLQELQSPKFATAKKIVSSKPIIRGKANDEVAEVTSSEEIESEPSKLPIKWIAAAFIAIGLIAGGIYWYKNYYEPSQVLVPVEEPVLPAIDSTILKSDSIKVDSAAVKVDTTKKIETPSLTSNEQFSSFGEGLNTYLSDNAKPTGQVFPMSNVAFVKGTQNLDAESDMIISELTDLMNKFPKMQIQLQGHSSNATGIDNKSMATKRAFVIKKKLTGAGIVDARIDAIGATGTGNGVDIKVVSK